MHFTLSASYLGTDLAGRYRVQRLIGEGATSWVFAAQDLRLEREVAVKLLRARTEQEYAAQRSRFVQEGRVLARLAHPHVVTVHDAGETPAGDGYLVMELSLAGTLEAELCRRSRLGLEEALQLIFPLLGALACAHDRGIIHRDLKPGNIALTHEGGKARAKLLDFGLASPYSHETSSGGVVGTPAYMAPEQARAETLRPGADVWSMGVVLFRCLSGELPFEAGSAAALLLKLVQERAPYIATVCPDLGPRVAVAIDRALEPDPAHRYADMRTFARVLALACRQDGVRIDSDPEPIGLPDFTSWLRQADVERTSPSELPVRPSQRSRPASKSTDASQPRMYARQLYLLPALAATAMLGTALWTTITRSAPSRDGSGQVAAPGPKPEGVPSLPAAHAPLDPVDSALDRATAWAEPVLSVAHAPVTSAQAPPAPPLRAKPKLRRPNSDGAKASDQPTSPPTPKLQPSESETSPKQGLVTTWEW